jgi:hypothetical protein
MTAPASHTLDKEEHQAKRARREVGEATACASGSAARPSAGPHQPSCPHAPLQPEPSLHAFATSLFAALTELWSGGEAPQLESLLDEKVDSQSEAASAPAPPQPTQPPEHPPYPSQRSCVKWYLRRSYGTTRWSQSASSAAPRTSGWGQRLLAPPPHRAGHSACRISSTSQRPTHYILMAER